MQASPEYVLVGTGLAPLIVAKRLHAEGRSVWILNPHSDFFLEDSEWSVDPTRSDEPETVHALLQSEYPGAMEIWPKPQSAGFHDVQAPHVRTRSRLLMWETGKKSPDISQLGDGAYRQCDGLTALRKFPGSSQKSRADLVVGLVGPHSYDVDVGRYRNGVLEFVRERLGPERIHVSVSGLEMEFGLLRFRSGANGVQAQGVKRMVMFWTPRVQQIRGIMPPSSQSPYLFWERWTLQSRDAVPQDCIATFNGLTVWAEAEGAPSPDGSHWISVLRTETSDKILPRWASESSFQELSRLFHDLLGWDRFSVHSMRSGVCLNSSCEGPLYRVVESAKKMSEELLAT